MDRYLNKKISQSTQSDFALFWITASLSLFHSLFPSFLSSTLPPSLLPGYLSIKSSQICRDITKYVQEDVMPFEKCLHVLIFLSETAALPLPQRRWLRSNRKIFTRSPPESHMQTVQKTPAKQEWGLAAHSLLQNLRGQQQGFNIGN